MNHQTWNGAGDMSAHIGALELGAIHAVDDGALEATVHAGPSTHLRRSTVCLNIDDRALEATTYAGPNAQVTLLRNSRRGCEFIDDSALEAMVLAGPQRPTAIRVPGGCLPGVDDSALEATVQVGPPATMRPMCRFIDDSALEQTAVHVEAGPPPTSVRFPNGGCNGR